MFRTSSPYVKHLLKGNIHWQLFTRETLETAISQEKIIFIHIGHISNIAGREQAYALFSDPRVAETINRNFIPVLLDIEDVPEASLIALDLLIINEQTYTIPINIFSLPGAKPFLSFSHITPEEFIALTENILNSYRDKRHRLEKMSLYMVERLQNTGVVTRKEPPKEINAKLLHAYVRSWYSKYIASEGQYHTPYTLNSRYYIFLLKYAQRYHKQEISDFIKHGLEKLYFSAMFDPVEGGVFTQSADYRFLEPLYEKSLSENVQMAILYSFGYKYFKLEIFRQAVENLTDFIEKDLKSGTGGYMSSVTLKIQPGNSRYYKYTHDELKKAFSSNYMTIGNYLGMNPDLPKDARQILLNTPDNIKIKPDERILLKRIREGHKNELLYDRRVITAYNCMYVSALCIIANNLEYQKEKYTKKAAELMEKILKDRKSKNITLYRYIGPGNKGYPGSNLLDYSLALNALLYLYKSTGEECYDELSRKYTAFILLNYYQADNGMFSSTSRLEQVTPFKRESVIDYIRFSANSIMARNLHMLYKLRKDTFYLEAFKQQLYNIEPHLIGSGPMMAGWGLQILNYLTDKTSNPDFSHPFPA